MGDTFIFETLGELRDFLNGFCSIDLDTVYPKESDSIRLYWLEECLSDGSMVSNVSMTTGDE